MLKSERISNVHQRHDSISVLATRYDTVPAKYGDINMPLNKRLTSHLTTRLIYQMTSYYLIHPASHPDLIHS